VIDFVPLIQKAPNVTKTSDMKSRMKEEFIEKHIADDVLIERNYLILGECIGRGNFGCVYKGIIRSTNNEVEEVAIKTLENCMSNSDLMVFE
jgi:hypothetical protein